MSSRTPAISVVTATRNRPHLLAQALKSIQEQTFEDFEAIVVDDGSPPEIHDEYARIWQTLDERFVLRQASPPGGPGSDPGRGRNVGTSMARAELIAYLDHDDLWVSRDHLAVGVAAMRATGASYYFTHVRFEPQMKDLMWAVPPQTFSSGREVTAASKVYEVPLSSYLSAMRHSHIHPSHSMVRKDAWERAGRFIEGLKTADDVNFMLRIADLDAGILYRPDACVAIRMPEGNSYSLSSSALNQILAECQALVDIRGRCRHAGVRRCARARQAWALRQLSTAVRASAPGESVRFAYESLLLYPTAGAVVQFCKTLRQTVSGRH